MVRISLYGRLRDHFGPDLELQTNGPCSVADLLERLAVIYPDGHILLANPRICACVENQLVGRDFSLDPSQTVDLLAPVSGG